MAPLIPAAPCFPHCRRSELSAERAAALLDEGRRTRYLDCRAGGASAVPSAGSQGGEQGPAVAADVLRQWPHAALQAVEGTCLPQVGCSAALVFAGCIKWCMWLPRHCHPCEPCPGSLHVVSWLQELCAHLTPPTGGAC